MIRVGVIGVGTVGRSVVEILQKNGDIIAARSGEEIVVTRGVSRHTDKISDLGIVVSTNPYDIVNDPNIDIVVELMGGIELPLEIVKKALANGKAVVTANKALLAYHRYELQEIAGNIPFEFEASVAGGIPIIAALREGLSANHILSIKGIMNGTCNFIMTKMMSEDEQLETVLAEAQALGYAEADPTFDVGGFDAAHKLLILASIAYGIDAKPEEILIEGIEGITQTDISFAKEFGYTIKLLGIAKREGNEVELRVHAALVKQEEMIAKIDGVMNAISVVGDRVGETLYYGPGAGGNATASAIVANIIDIARSGKRSPMLGYHKPLEEGLQLKKTEEMRSQYYLRLRVSDKPGILAQITNLFAENGLSIEAVVQRPSTSESAHLLFATHEATEKALRTLMIELGTLESVLEKPFMIRIV